MSADLRHFTLPGGFASEASSLAVQLLISTLLATMCALFVWRLWRFSLSPIFRPEEPREVPYWVPSLGHARNFLKNQDQTFCYGREYFKNTREPFAITLGREKLYILTSHHDVNTLFKSSTTLDYGNVIKDLMVSFGASWSAVEAIYAPNPEFSGDILQQNTHNKSLFHLKSDFYHTQLLPGKNFCEIQERFLRLISDAVTLDSLAKVDLLSFTENASTVHLYKMCQRVFVKAGLKAFFGERILNGSPQLLQDFIDFDDNNWMVFYNWKGPGAQAMHKPKARVLNILEDWLKLPKTERSGAAWLIETMEESQRQLGMDDRDIAVVLMMLMWVVNTNAYRVCFWMLAYIMHFADLKSTIEAETSPAFERGASADVSSLTANCPHLDSLWFEVLRLTNASSTIRSVLKPTRIGTKILKPGYKVMCPFRQLHFDEAVYGECFDEFDPDRFFRDAKLSRHASYKPFGGGATMCPGRFVARQEVYVFVTLFLHRFESHMGQSRSNFPRFELETPTTGIISPKGGDDVVVYLREKTLVPEI